jgi:predicted Na+-dependent transporter
LYFCGCAAAAKIQLENEETMDLRQMLMTVMNLSTLVFVVTSMLAMGMSLALVQILAPLRNTRLLILALAANFILAPAAAYLTAGVFPLSAGQKTGLVLISTAAGAPFLPRLAQLAKGNLAFSVGLMVFLMVTTILYMPLVLPLLLGDVSVNPWEIARPLIFLMLIPLAAGLWIKARYARTARAWQPHLAKASTFALVLLVSAGLLANLEAMIGIVGITGILAGLLFVAVCFVAGYLLGGKDDAIRPVLGLGTAQRNLSAALVIATANFSQDPDVVLMVLVLGLLDISVLVMTANLLGRGKYDYQPG